MPEKPIDQIVKAYWEHYDAARSANRGKRLEADRTFWAWEAVDHEVSVPSERIFELLLALARAAKDDEALAYLGAGPIEDLITRHGSQLLDGIDQWARRDPAFRKALSDVWITRTFRKPCGIGLASTSRRPRFIWTVEVRSGRQERLRHHVLPSPTGCESGATTARPSLRRSTLYFRSSSSSKRRSLGRP